MNANSQSLSSVTGRRSSTPLIALCLLSCGWSAAAAHGQGLDFFWSPSGQLPNSGPWSSAGHWGMESMFPGSHSTYDNAEIGFISSEPYTITLDVDPTIDLFRIVSPNATFAVNNRTLTLRGSAFINEGHVEWTSSTLQYLILKPSPSLTIMEAGTMRSRGTSVVNMPNFRVFGELTIEGGGGSVPATLTSIRSLENEIPGSIILTATSSASSVLQVNTGKLFNEGVVDLRNPLSVQRNRYIRADVDNYGTFDVRDDVIGHFDQSGSEFTNHGLLQIKEGAELNFPSGRTLTHVDGLIHNMGTLKLNSATFNYEGGWILALGPPVELTNSTLNFGPASGGGEFLLRGTTTFFGDVINEHILTVEAGGGSVPSTLLSAEGFSSLGVINLISTSSAVSMLEIINGTLSNWGHLFLHNPHNAQRTRHLRAHVDNFWRLDILDNVIAHFDRANGVYTNHFMLIIDPEGEVHVPSGRTLSQVNGTLINDGLLELNSATFNYDGGLFTGNTMRLSGNSTLNIAPEAGGGSFLVLGTTTLNGDLADNHVVTVQAGGGSVPAQLVSATDFENDGVINLITTSSAASLLEISSGTLSNYGVVNMHNPHSAQAWRAIRSHLDNFGVIDIADNVTAHFDRNNGVYTNHGLIYVGESAELHVPSGRTLTQAGGTLNNNGTITLNSATFNYEGGSFTGNTMRLSGNSTLNIAPEAGGGSFLVLGTTTLNGDLAGDHVVTVQAGGGSVPAQLVSATDFENDGVINLITTSSAASLLDISSGTLSNYGVVNMHNPHSAQAWRAIRAHLNNFGTIAIADNVVAHFDRNKGVCNNHGLIQIAEDAELHVPSGRTLNNEADGTLAFEIASSSDFARVTGSGNVSLDGELKIVLVGDQLPDANDSFAIITASNMDGFFANAPPSRSDVGVISFPGGTFNVTYNPTSVVLTGFVHVPCDIPADFNCDDVVDGADLLILLSQWGQCADPNDCPADLNSDGTVDGADLLILLAAWGQGGR